MNIFMLAENLGMTVARMTREMPLSEFLGWLRFHRQRNEESTEPPAGPQTRDEYGAFFGGALGGG